MVVKCVVFYVDLIMFDKNYRYKVCKFVLLSCSLISLELVEDKFFMVIYIVYYVLLVVVIKVIYVLINKLVNVKSV